MRWQWKGGATLSGTGPWRNVATGETSPGDHAGARQERSVKGSLDSHRVAREPGNGVGRQGAGGL